MCIIWHQHYTYDVHWWNNLWNWNAKGIDDLMWLGQVESFPSEVPLMLDFEQWDENQRTQWNYKHNIECVTLYNDEYEYL